MSLSLFISLFLGWTMSSQYPGLRYWFESGVGPHALDCDCPLLLRGGLHAETNSNCALYM